MIRFNFRVLLFTTILLTPAFANGQNLLPDPSFEKPMAKNRFGSVFEHWGGWMYAGECEFRVSDLAHTGKHSLLMVGGLGAKIRAWPNDLTLEPGRYRITAWMRGIGIGIGQYGETTEFMFDGKYIQLKKNGTFGWIKLTYVGDVKEKRAGAAHPSFGLMMPGYLWIDDVSVERVGANVPLTPVPVFGPEEARIAPPVEPGPNPVRCPECGFLNHPGQTHCYGCGTALPTHKAATQTPPVKAITSFEGKNPFGGGTIVNEHATDGTKALRVERGFVSMDGTQNWAGYDYLKADVYTDSKVPVPLDIEMRDAQTRDYWTRVNYSTVIPPGTSTLAVPTALYVGEKSRPGRPLQLDAVTRLVFAVGDKPPAPLYFDNIRLERDTETAKMKFDGLFAFSAGPMGKPLMEGFTSLHAGMTYARGRGFGWKDARFWRSFDALQPDPLYRNFLCVEKGGLAIDVPNGRYVVFVNMDSPSGYWGEVQRYRKRAIIVEGHRFEDTMTLDSFKKHYYRHADTEDLPSDNTFDRYQVPYFKEKFFEAEVRDGQLNIDFEGDNWACCVSAIIVYPKAKAAEGERFLSYVKERRRFHFDNAFKRVLPPPTGEPAMPTKAEQERGFIAFARDWMKDVNVNDRPLPGEKVEELKGAAFAGEYEPVALSLLPLRDLGQAVVSVTDLQGPGGAAIPASAIDVGHVQHRISRVTMEGSVYTIAPKLIQPHAAAPVPAGVTRTFWLTVKVPGNAPPGLYNGSVKLKTERGGELTMPLKFTVRKGMLDPVDIPAGPWSHMINLPWFEEETAQWNHAMAAKSLQKLRAYGFTTASGLPELTLRGFKNGVPDIDFSRGDAQMKLFREQGFKMPVITYCEFHGLSTYYKDENAMRAAGFSDYSQYIKAIFTAVQRHADQAGWLPVYWNIADEPVGDDLSRAADNAEAYRKAFPKGPPYFTGASSFRGNDVKDPHFRLSRALHVADWNEHDLAAVKLQQSTGSDWAFYNGGNRWTYGIYMYKAAKQHGMKFRLAWHWNNVAGDPYYALDCREDDYAWCNSTADGALIPSVEFERLREGLGDYRRLVTLSRLAKEQAGKSPAAADADKLIADILTTFALGDRELPAGQSFTTIRARLDAAIERLR
jgi:hypothetical protein